MGSKQSSSCKHTMGLHQISSLIEIGDILLERKQVYDPNLGISFDAGIIRGISSTQKGSCYAIQKRKLPGWTHVGLLCKVDDKIHIVQCTNKGIEISKFDEVVESSQQNKSKLVVRRLHQNRTDDMNKGLEAILSALVRNPIGWDQWKHEGRKKTSPAVAEAFIRMEALIQKNIQSLTLEQQIEIKCGYLELSDSETSTIGIEQNQIIKDLYQTVYNLELVHSSQEWEIVVKGWSCERMKLADILQKLNELPKSRIPHERDMDGIFMACFVASVYQEAGVLPEDLELINSIEAGLEIPSQLVPSMFTSSGGIAIPNMGDEIAIINTSNVGSGNQRLGFF